MYEFHWPTKTLIGSGTLNDLPEHLLQPTPHRKLMIAAPQEDWAQPLLARLTASLIDRGWQPPAIFAEIEPNPSWETVRAGTETALINEANVVLAVGGGSTLDAAKVIAERAEALFLCTVPTTAGTGGEISPWAVISNLETREKESLIAKWPDLTVLDPELTTTLPPRITLFTGIDAFIHGLEAYLASAANPITDALALKGMELVDQHLETAVESGENLPARQGMLEGSLLTGAAMLHAGLGLMHAIGNVTGGLYHELPHGLILMSCMDAVLDYNQPAAGKKYRQIGPLVDRIRSLTEAYFQQLSIPEVVVRSEDLDTLAERAAVNVNAKTNPRPAGPEEIQGVVRKAFRVQ